MSEESAQKVFEQLKKELIGGRVRDIGVYFEGRQPFLKMLLIESNNTEYTITFEAPPKINGDY
jgi:hypothetical protein